MDANTSSGASARSFPWIINRSYTFLLTGETVSILGDFFFDTTLTIWIAASVARGQPWAPAAVSGLLLAAAVPTVAVGTFAGVLVDRWDRRRIMLAADAARAALVLALIAFSGLIPFVPIHLPALAELAAIYITVALSTSCGRFFQPARAAIIQQIVPVEDQPAASSYGQIADPIATILGPPIAAPLYFALGPAWALLVNAASFLLSFVAVWLVPVTTPATQEESGFLAEFRKGISFYLRNRILVVITVTVMIAQFGAGAINALDIFFVRRNLHAPFSLYGALEAAFGVGFLAGSIATPFLVRRLGLLRAFWLGAAVTALLIIGYARANSFWSGVIILFFAATPLATVNAAVGPIVMRITPPTLMGRVIGVLQPAISLSSILSIALAGILVSVLNGFHADVAGISFGPIDTVFVASGVVVLAAAAYAGIALRHAELPESIPEEVAQPAP
ncbi:MAG TPA: MFS transporter [Chloroflexota bacterium]|nr:MFS transporter [Chloroflexota bacterium]